MKAKDIVPGDEYAVGTNGQRKDYISLSRAVVVATGYTRPESPFAANIAVPGSGILALVAERGEMTPGQVAAAKAYPVETAVAWARTAYSRERRDNANRPPEGWRLITYPLAQVQMTWPEWVIERAARRDEAQRQDEARRREVAAIKVHKSEVESEAARHGWDIILAGDRVTMTETTWRNILAALEGR